MMLETNILNTKRRSYVFLFEVENRSIARNEKCIVEQLIQSQLLSTAYRQAYLYGLTVIIRLYFVIIPTLNIFVKYPVQELYEECFV